MAAARLLRRTIRPLNGLAVFSQQQSLLRPASLLSPSSPPPLCEEPYPWHLPFRCAVSAAGDFGLLRALKDEIAHEKDVDDVAKQVRKSPPKPFTIVDKPGVDEVYLHRSYEGEDITVGCYFQNEPISLDDEEADMEQVAATKTVQMTVKIKKAGRDYPCLAIVCTTYGDDPIIERISFVEDAVARDLPDLPYDGPAFMDFDDDVKTGFLKYLLARGIDAQVGAFIIPYMYHREQQQYLRWLRNVEAFISK